jgi:outer membrane lipoprotein-sorting protein
MRLRILCALASLALVLAAVPAAAQEAAAKGADVLKAAAAAAGGEALAKIRTLTFRSSGTVSTPMGQIDIDSNGYVAFPDKSRMDIVFPMGEMQNGFDGTTPWISSAQGVMEMPADFAKEARRNTLLVGGVGVLQEALSGKATASYVGPKDFNGARTECVEWEGPSGKVKLYFDAESKLLVGAQYRALGQQGAFEEERRWSDFKGVEGVQFATHVVTLRDGAPYSDITISDVKLNPPLEDKLFKKP